MLTDIQNFIKREYLPHQPNLINQTITKTTTLHQVSSGQNVTQNIKAQKHDMYKVYLECNKMLHVFK